MGFRHGLEVSKETLPKPAFNHNIRFPVKTHFTTLDSGAIANAGGSYALQWLFSLPVEMISGALAIQYWNASLNPSIFVTIFLLAIVAINLMGIKGYGEAEFIFSTVKVTAIVGFM